MDLIKKILAPTDLSALSAKGVRYACSLAKVAEAEVIVAHVVRTEEFLSHARKLRVATHREQETAMLDTLVDHHKAALEQFLKEQLSDINPAPQIRQVVEMGDPHSKIIEWAKREKADLIVICTHGRSGLSRMLLGSVTEKVLKSWACPVLAIPPH